MTILRQKSEAIFVIAGPTASGKTQLGVDLALRVGGEVINCDSVQIYKQIQIATAKPSEAEMRGVPHHLIGYVDPNVDYTAGDWSRDATAKIYEIEARNKVPILVGGTGFYLRALRQPLFESPKTDTGLRERFRRIRKDRGAEHLYRMLMRVDQATAKKLEPRDYVRVMRALEVYFQTGEPLSRQQPNLPEPPEFTERLSIFVLNPPRAELYEKINARSIQHFEAGLVDEVKQLLADGVRVSGNALGAHAYRRVCEFLRGERDLVSAVEQSKQDVRNYAKRQMTWFRREPGVIWLDGFGTDPAIVGKLFGIIGTAKEP